MTDTIIEQIEAIKDTGLVDMESLQDVFKLALELEYDALADFIFSDTDSYNNFIRPDEDE